MKRLYLNPLKLLMLALALVVSLTFNAFAEKTLDTRMESAEKVRITLPYNVSDTINAANNYAVISPVKGWVTGLYYTHLGPAAITSGSSANIVAKIGGVSMTTISVTVVSGTQALGVISSTVAAPRFVSTTGDVNRGQVIELDDTGSPVMTGTVGGPGFMTLEITPNYY